MKKYLIFILCVILSMSTLSGTVYAQQDDETDDLHYMSSVENPVLPDGYELTEYLLNRADVNEDGEITPSDARLALRAAAGLEELSEHQNVMADIDADGKVSTNDARDILRFSVSIDNLYPVMVRNPANKPVVLGPLTGNSEYCWYVKAKNESINLNVIEKRIDLSETEFEQSFEIDLSEIAFEQSFEIDSDSFWYWVTLVYGTPDGETVIKEYEFEIFKTMVIDEVIIG